MEKTMYVDWISTDKRIINLADELSGNRDNTELIVFYFFFLPCLYMSTQTELCLTTIIKIIYAVALMAPFDYISY